MKTKQQRIQDFNDWMLKIKNVYYAQNQLMLNAYNRID